jgi:hypothetical protein
MRTTREVDGGGPHVSAGVREVWFGPTGVFLGRGEILAKHGSIFLFPFLFPVFLIVVLSFRSKLDSNLSL